MFPAGAAVLLAGCGTLRESNSKNHVVTQASTYDALYHGLYDGEAPLRQLAPLGHLGLGTVDHFDGEVVLLEGKFHVIRTSDGEIRWMDVSAHLKRESAGGKTVRQIVFAGEQFDAVSAQNWRKKMLLAKLQPR